jgi:hypothetical protein
MKIPSSDLPLLHQVGRRRLRWRSQARLVVELIRVLHKTWGPLHFLVPIIFLNFPPTH